MRQAEKETRIYSDDLSPEAIAESGQCFRMRQAEDGSIVLIAYERKLRIRHGETGELIFSCTEEDLDRIWRPYFDLDRDYGDIRAHIRKDDSFLQEAAAFGRGIRILRQDPWEMLISFIISQRKSIPAIRTAIEKLCENFGKELFALDAEGQEIVYHAFPEPEALLKADEDSLASCGLGYRLPYVREAALAWEAGRLSGLSDLPTEELIHSLMELHGVGVKVASCVALFGYHRLEVAPVDVWMQRVIDGVYGGSLPEEYKEYAGVIQQYLFNYARLTKLEAL